MADIPRNLLKWHVACQHDAGCYSILWRWQGVVTPGTYFNGSGGQVWRLAWHQIQPSVVRRQPWSLLMIPITDLSGADLIVYRPLSYERSTVWCSVRQSRNTCIFMKGLCVTGPARAGHVYLITDFPWSTHLYEFHHLVAFYGVSPRQITETDTTMRRAIIVVRFITGTVGMGFTYRNRESNRCDVHIN